VLPPRPRRTWTGAILAALLGLAVLITLSGGAATAFAVRASAATGTSNAFVGDLRPQTRNPALQALLDRRAKAVREKNKTAFMADVDRTDASFVRKQELEYDNLTKLPLVEFTYQLEEFVQYDELISTQLRGRFRSMVRAPGVDVRYRIDGVDGTPVATPWVPVFGFTGGGWRVVGEANGKQLPLGINGQPWDAGAIAVVTSRRVVAVMSAEDAGRAPTLLKMSESALDRVAAVRPNGWAGKVLVTAVQDSAIFDTYFGDSPDRVNQVAAIAVPYYSLVPAWHREARYTATRVVFNPSQLTADDVELAHDLTHEFTHAAMGPVTSDHTPLWLVEGFAEYVPFKTEHVSTQALHRVLSGLSSGSLPDSTTFYNEPRNYVLGWLACRLIAETYGEAKLVQLYENLSNGSADLRQTLGVDEATFTKQWSGYVERARTSTLP
jgi:hypothetical protein